MRSLLVVLAMAVLAGCGGMRKAAVRADPPVPALADPPPSDRSAAELEADARERREREEREERERQRELPRQVHQQVAERMPRQAPAVHLKVARTVLAESTRARVDPLLVLAMIHVESSFDPRAVSRAGAMGLMQVRVSTLRQELSRPRARRADALDPLTNVQGGVRYLRRLIDAFGATDLALMAYNAGPARLRALLARGEIPPRIRDYSRKVWGEVERLRAVLRVRAIPPAETAADD